MDAPSLPGTCFKVLGGQGYDDSGVTDLGLLIDFGDSVLRRRHGGEIEFFIALKKDGHMAKMSRQSLNVSLVELLSWMTTRVMTEVRRTSLQALSMVRMTNKRSSI